MQKAECRIEVEIDRATVGDGGTHCINMTKRQFIIYGFPGRSHNPLHSPDREGYKLPKASGMLT